MQCEYLYAQVMGIETPRPRFSWFNEESHNGEWYAYILYWLVSWTVSGESYAYILHCLGPRKQKTHDQFHPPLDPYPTPMLWL